jgi:hyaluronoglucosaminidase
VSPPLGVIEGFFGKPWTDTARLACAEFLRPRGFDFYVYAPKADRFLRRQWATPFAAPALTQIGELSRQMRDRAVRFGIGLSPYDIHLNYDAGARAALRAKVAQLDEIGTDLLCILFDDMPGSFAGLAQLQARVAADITEWSAAAAFIVCPTYYSDDPVLGRVFGPAPPNYLQDLGRGLDPAVDVFWTGRQVCSPGYPDEHLEEVATRLGRRPFIWDNHIANDGKLRCSHVYLDPHSSGWSLNRRLAAGLAVNPMNQPGLSRIALAAYAANDAALESHVRSVCSAPLGAALLGDVDLFQRRGIAALDAAGRSALTEKYRRFEPEWCAGEIVAWLEGEYDFDANCLTE